MYRKLALVLAFVACVSGAPAKESGIFCSICEAATAEILPDLRSNATEHEIVAALDKVCAILPSSIQPDCEKAVVSFAQLIVNADTYVWVKYSPRAVCGILGGLCTFECCNPVTPEGIHLAYTGRAGELRIMWSTLKETPDSTVQWDVENGWETDMWASSASGTQTTYNHGGWVGTLHDVLVTGLTPGQRYFYRVGAVGVPGQWFKAQWSEDQGAHFWGPTENAKRVNFALYGDTGASDQGDMTSFRVAQLAQSQQIDFVSHIGDISYADGYQPLWDQYMRKFATTAGFVPYMTMPGNHEGFYEFAAYRARFHMPYETSNSTDRLYYSFNNGPVHFVALRTEGPDGLYPFQFTPDSLQYQWLEADLAAAATPAARAVRPWIVVMGHRPLYCSDSKKSDCVLYAEGLRRELEPLFTRYKVSLYFGAHIHHYERTMPVTDNGVISGTYAAPSGTVHVLSGAGGNKERFDKHFVPSQWATGAQIALAGFSLCHANTTVFSCEFVLSGNGTVGDAFDLSLWH